MMMIKKYGYIAIPFLYWMIYLTVRVLHSGTGWMNDAEFTESLRHDLVLIIISLAIFSFGCFFVEEKVGCLIFILSGAISFHLAGFIIALIVFLWEGQFLWGVMMEFQKVMAVLMLGFPVFIMGLCRKI